MVSQFPDWTYSYASTGILATTVTFLFCISSGGLGGRVWCIQSITIVLRCGETRNSAVSASTLRGTNGRKFRATSFG